MFLVVPKSQVANYLHAKDRRFFSAPVQVEPLYTDLATRLVYVRSPLQGGMVYPTERKYLKSEFFLTNEQKRQARRA